VKIPQFFDKSLLNFGYNFRPPIDYSNDVLHVTAHEIIILPPACKGLEFSDEKIGGLQQPYLFTRRKIIPFRSFVCRREPLIAET
jgi:hypothetical protein